MQPLSELLSSCSKNNGRLLNGAESVQILFLSRLPTTYNHSGGYGTFSTGELLASQVTGCAMCQKPQCLKGNKKPAWLCYFHMVSLHMGQPHILRSGPFWPFHNQCKNQRVTLHWPSAPPLLERSSRERANFVFTPSLFYFRWLLSRDISLA